MLLYDFTYVTAPAAVVRDRILADTGGWLSSLATAAAGGNRAHGYLIHPASTAVEVNP